MFLKVNYRSLLPHETSFLKEMLYQALHVPEGQAPFPRSILEKPEIAKYIQNWGNRKDDSAIVAEIEGILVGAIWGRLFTLEEKSYGFVNEQTPEISMAVRGKFRGKGIGTKLIQEIVAEYSQLDYESLSLSVDKNNPAQRLYERMGFELYEDAGSAITMRMEL